jgi:hypothetical protein
MQRDRQECCITFENLIKERLQESATLIREQYLKKPIGKNNVAVAEVHLQFNVAFCVGGTSRGGKKSPIPQPKTKSEGGQFEGSIS